MSRKYDEIKAFLKAEALKPESRLRMPTIAELVANVKSKILFLHQKKNETKTITSL